MTDKSKIAVERVHARAKEVADRIAVTKRRAYCIAFLLCKFGDSVDESQTYVIQVDQNIYRSDRIATRFCHRQGSIFHVYRNGGL